MTARCAVWGEAGRRLALRATPDGTVETRATRTFEPASGHGGRLLIVGDGNCSVRGTGGTPTQKRESQLKTLRDLYKRKLISESEYENERKRAIQDFGNASR
ncbi:MAG: SHOCT domain-containing protein [Candidatus Binatia bacterium]|nr:SHOCT domain-containing protein [Candidatus Binatia bacterium]